MCPPLRPLSILTLLLLIPLTARSDEGENELALQARSILEKHCAQCHGPRKALRKLNVLDHEGILKHETRRDGKFLDLNNPDQSALIKRIESPDEPMPPEDEGPAVSKESLALLRRWIQAGAPSPQAKVVKKPEVKEPTIPPPPPEKKTETSVQLLSEVKAIFRKNCFQCHNESKRSGSVVIFDVKELHKSKWVIGGDPEASPLYQLLVEDDPGLRMPQGGGPLSAEDLRVVREWILRGGPELLPDLDGTGAVGAEVVLKTIRKDVERLRKDEGVERLRRYRYLSFNHLVAGGITQEDLSLHAKALLVALNHLTWKPTLYKPEAIDELKTIYRIDLTKLGWDEQPYRTIEEGEPTRTVAPINLFDVLLLNYPYGVIGEASEEYLELHDLFLSEIEQARPVPYVRGDWLINAALQPPLYHDLLKLPHQLHALEEKILQAPSERNIARGDACRAGMAISGVSRNNRIVERHEPRGGIPYYWKSYDYATSRDKENIFAHPVDLDASGGEMIWGLPNGMQGYFITDAKGNRLDSAPVSIVTDTFASDSIVRNGVSCIRCHGQGMKTFRDDVRVAVEELRGNPEGFDRLTAKRLYIPKAKMDELVARDRKRFQSALQDLLGEKVDLSLMFEMVVKRYADEAVSGRQAAAELGAANPEAMKSTFNIRDAATMGIAQLAYNGYVRRDAWEDYYDRIMKELLRGTPVVPLDSDQRTSYNPQEKLDIRLSTNRKPGTGLKAEDAVAIFVRNHSKHDARIEVHVLTHSGSYVRLTDGVVKLAAGETFRYPEGEEYIDVDRSTGTDRVILFASTESFEPGKVFRLSKHLTDQGYHMRDCLYHPFYEVKRSGASLRVTKPPERFIKRSIDLTTE